MQAVLGPWPWWIAGPVIGATVPILLWLGNRQLGLSSNLRHLCAATLPGKPEFLRYDWRAAGAWNLSFVAGVLLGGFIAVRFLGAGEVAFSDATREGLMALGLADFSGLAPAELFAPDRLLSPRTLVFLIGGGLCIGFGTQWAGGCTSGHGLAGLANLEAASLIAVLGFFAGGLIGAHLIVPTLLRAFA